MTGGILTEQKTVRKVSFKSLEQSLVDPGVVIVFWSPFEFSECILGTTEVAI